MTRVLVHLGPVDLIALLDLVAESLSFEEPLYLLHVSDPQAQGEVERAMHGLVAGHGVDRRHLQMMQASVSGALEAVRAEADWWSSDRGVNTTFIAREGKVEREIVDVATEISATTIVVQPASSATGPGSVGPLVHFVGDHAKCSVWLARVPE